MIRNESGHCGAAVDFVRIALTKLYYYVVLKNEFLFDVLGMGAEMCTDKNLTVQVAEKDCRGRRCSYLSRFRVQLKQVSTQFQTSLAILSQFQDLLVRTYILQLPE